MERTGIAARWDETVIDDWMEKGQTVRGDIMKEAADALERAEAREAEEVRVRLMETNRDELIDMTGKVEGQADETEPGLLIELGEEIEYRRDNLASMAKMLKGNIHEELGERAQRALDESMEVARVGQQKQDALRARLEFHSFDSKAGSYAGTLPAREAAPGCHPPANNVGQQGAGSLSRPGPVEGGQAIGSQAGSTDLASLLRGWEATEGR